MPPENAGFMGLDTHLLCAKASVCMGYDGVLAQVSLLGLLWCRMVRLVPEPQAAVPVL